MPRAFDRGVPPLDKNPLQSATTWDDPQGVIGEAASLYGEFIKQWVTTLLEDGLANVFKDCTGGFIEGLRQLGAGETDLAKIGDGLNTFIDTLVATLLCKAEGAVTPQDLLSTVGNIFDLLGASPLIQQLQALVESSGSGLEDALGGAFTVLSSLLGDFTVEDFLMPLLAWIQWLWDQFGDVSETFLKPVLNLIKSVWDAFTTAAVAAGSTATVWLGDLFEFLGWVWETFGPVVDTFLKPVATLIKTIWDTFAAAAVGTGQTATSLLTGLFSFLSWLWNGAAGGFAGFRTTVDTVLKPAFEFLNWLFGSLFAGAIDSLKAIFTALENLLDGAGSLETWLEQIPLIGPLVSIITGKSPLDGVTMDLTTLGNWARDVLTQATDIPAANLKGLLPPGVLSSIPLSNINFDTPNLLSQGDFGNAGTIEAVDGWSWDANENHSGSGGCAKVTCNGTARRLYSNQVIKVVAGDRINLSSYVKTSADFAGSSTCIELILVPFAGTSRYTVGGSPVNIYFSTTGASSSWSQVTGSSGSGTAPWTVPAGVTSVRVRLSVTSAATAGSVWFDDVDIHKTGLLSGEWMNGIIGTVADDFEAIVNNIITGILGSLPGGTANPIYGVLTSLQTIFSRLFNTLSLPTNLTSNPLLANAIPGLNATKIVEGTFGTARIADDAITTAKIGPDAVTTTEIATDAVTQNELAPNAVGSTEIINGSVTGGASGELATNTVTSNNVNEVDGTKIQSGTVNIDRLPTDAIGAEINPTQGSGAQLIRSTTEPVAPRSVGGSVTARTFTPDGFFTSLGTSSTDIQCLTTSGAAATGTRNDYAGAFKVTLSGWYLVEIAYRVNVSFGDGGFQLAPVLFKGTSLASQTAYKVGTDCHFVWLITTSSAQRFVQNSFIVYLNANEVVRSGTDITYAGGNISPPILGGQSGTGTSGVETYFSISLLNRSFA